MCKIFLTDDNDFVIRDVSVYGNLGLGIVDRFFAFLCSSRSLFGGEEESAREKPWTQISDRCRSMPRFPENPLFAVTRIEPVVQ